MTIVPSKYRFRIFSTTERKPAIIPITPTQTPKCEKNRENRRWRYRSRRFNNGKGEKGSALRVSFPTHPSKIAIPPDSDQSEKNIYIYEKYIQSIHLQKCRIKAGFSKGLDDKKNKGFFPSIINSEVRKREIFDGRR